jgi:ribosomal protein L11 methylase PrmA
VTEISTGADGGIWSPDGKNIVFVSAVYPDCKDDACNKQRDEEMKKSKVKAKVFSRLFYRHWSAFTEFKRSHLFVVGADAVESAVPSGETPNALRTAHTTARVKEPRLLVIPASAAFGTGEHATTAMSLRLLERLTREWKNSWSLADLGTGSGILALAAERFGSRRVVGIDVDPKAISVAKANARLNKIDNVDFKLGDLRKWKSWAGKDIVAANLYSELLIEILPKLKRGHWLILSGVLRIHENKLFHALRRNKIEIVKVNRRGKWIAVLAKASHASRLRISPKSDQKSTRLWICASKL